MKLVLNRKNSDIDAKGEYNPETKVFIVKKGSIVSETISDSENWKGASSIEDYRAKFVRGNVVKEDVEFTSSSTAANFVTGSSSNGLVTWKSSNGKTLKEELELLNDLELVLKRKDEVITAKGSYNPETKSFIVKKGSLVSQSISDPENWKSASSIEDYRAQFVRGNVVKEDVEFTSSSTAANFITGVNTNGLVAWKTSDGRTIKELLND
jgi:hypothetical protein